MMAGVSAAGGLRRPIAMPIDKLPPAGARAAAPEAGYPDPRSVHPAAEPLADMGR